MRTMADVAAGYDETRNQILARVQAGKISASMSGIEYYPKPWSELDLDDPSDFNTIATEIGWNGDERIIEMRRLSSSEITRNRERSRIMHEPVGPEREQKLKALDFWGCTAHNNIGAGASIPTAADMHVVHGVINSPPSPDCPGHLVGISPANCPRCKAQPPNDGEPG